MSEDVDFLHIKNVFSSKKNEFEADNIHKPAFFKEKFGVFSVEYYTKDCNDFFA